MSAPQLTTTHTMPHLFTSQRLGFRQWQISDKAPYAAMNANPKVRQYFPSTLSVRESNASYDRLKSHIKQNGFGFFAVDLLSTNEFAGFIGFVKTPFEADFTPCVEIGWRLRESLWNQGLATEGALRSLEYAFENWDFDSIYSFTAVQNKPSERVMQKIGMHKVKEFDHPKVPAYSPLLRHVLYKIDRPH